MKILDKKTTHELNKHRSNIYKSCLINRPTMMLDKEFTMNNIINNNNCFLVNITKFSGFEGHYYFNKNDPLVNTALQLLENINLKLEESYLFNYYQNFQPKTCGDLYKLNLNNKLHNIKSTTFFHPWIHSKPTTQFRAGLFGPKDITNVEHRILRLKNLINNINEFGYSPIDKDIIEGYILQKNDDFRFVITGGHHRVAVLTAMYQKNKKYELIQVKYDTERVRIKIIKENDVLNWPGVKSGYLNENDAIEMFNKYFI